MSGGLLVIVPHGLSEILAKGEVVDRYYTPGNLFERVDIVMTAIVLLALLGKSSDSILKYAERRLLSWRDVYEGS